VGHPAAHDAGFAEKAREGAASAPALVPGPPSPGARSALAGGRLARAVFRLRPEEAIALLFLVPTTWLTVAANVYARREGLLGDRYPGGVARLAVAAALIAVVFAARRAWPRSVAAWRLRETLPFLACILIYTNLHDTIGFVNAHDIHARLDAFDRRLFGVQPVLWAERFISPGRTELMSFLYINFFWIAPSVPLLLLLRGRWRDYRTATLGIVVCFYLGYALYVLFPAAPPRLTLTAEFTRPLRGYGQVFSVGAARAFELLPVDSRAAFPSLHAAVSLLALVYAWRFLRGWFWVLTPFVAGLWLSTVYLRHHYVADLLAGWLLAPLAAWGAPRLDAWWARRAGALPSPPRSSG
jgi:membrane-associated phospholipid phosphatase